MNAAIEVLVRKKDILERQIKSDQAMMTRQKYGFEGYLMALQKSVTENTEALIEIDQAIHILSTAMR